MTEQKPTAEALKVAHELFMIQLGHVEGRLLSQCRCCSDYSREDEQNHTKTCTFYKVATLITAKDVEIERLKFGIEIQSGQLQAHQDHHAQLLNEMTALKTSVISTIGGQVEGHPTGEQNYLQRLRELVSIADQNQQWRALLVSLAKLLTMMCDKAVAYAYRPVATERGMNSLLNTVAKAQQKLSTPAVVELLKEAQV